jgi:6-phosphofructokinase 1
VEIIRNRQKNGKKFSIIVVSEDAKILLDIGKQKPQLLQTPMLHDEYGNIKLGGISSLLEKNLRTHLKMEVRSTVLGYIQRGGSPTAYDRVLATRLGVGAVELFLKGRTGRMVGLKGNKIKSIPLKQVIGKLKTVDRDLYRIGEIFFG